ncbi:hypothetical protein JXO52_02295 [bacterium]|nr:hypothetical protein [bacterium]
MQDFLEWMKHAWPVQKTWGADTVEYWQEENSNLVICRYAVSDIARWMRMAQSPQGVEISEGLGEIVDMDGMSLKITRNDAFAA